MMDNLISKSKLYSNQYTRCHPHIMDDDIPDIGVEPIKPSPAKGIVKKVASFVRKKANDVADWILSLTLKAVKKVLPLKILDLIEWSKVIPYEHSITYWKLNIPYSSEVEIARKITNCREQYGNENTNKYIKMYYYNNIHSLNDVKQAFLKTYEKESNAFKLMFSFGYVLEKANENSGIWEPKLHVAGQNNYYHKQPFVVKSKGDIENLLSDITEDSIVRKLTNDFPDTKTRLVGIFSLGIKITRLDYPVGTTVKLPNYIKNSSHIVGLEDVTKNMCFWACIA